MNDSTSPSNGVTFPLYSGITPSKYLIIIDTVLFNKLPNELAKSVLHLSTNCSGEKLPSVPKLISLAK